MLISEFIFITACLALLIGVAYWIRIPRASIPLGAIYILFIFMNVKNPNQQSDLQITGSPIKLNNGIVGREIEPISSNANRLISDVKPKPLMFDSGRVAKDNIVSKSQSLKLSTHEIENTESEKQPTQKIYISPTIKDIRICKNVQNRAPVGSNTYFLNNTDSLFCYTRIQNSGGKQQIAHLWYYKEKLVSKIKYNIKRSNIYRSWTHNTIRTYQTGIWRVDVQDSSGTVIGSKTFYITDSTKSH